MLCGRRPPRTAGGAPAARPARSGWRSVVSWNHPPARPRKTRLTALADGGLPSSSTASRSRSSKSCILPVEQSR